MHVPVFLAVKDREPRCDHRSFLLLHIQTHLGMQLRHQVFPLKIIAAGQKDFFFQQGKALHQRVTKGEMLRKPGFCVVAP